MNDWLKNTTAKLKSMWAAWKPIQKAIAAGILVAVIVVLVIVFRGSSKPTTVPLFRTPITDEAKRDEIITHLEQKNVDFTYNETTGIFTVPDERTAKRIRTDLTTEGILSSAYNVWDEELNVRDWTTTDFERNERKLQRVNNQIKQQLESLDWITEANVVIIPGKDSLFESQSEPATASVTLSFKGGASITREQIQGVQNLILRSVSGLMADNIIILNTAGETLNNFEDLAESDRREVEKSAFNTQKFLHSAPA